MRGLAEAEILLMAAAEAAKARER